MKITHIGLGQTPPPSRSQVEDTVAGTGQSASTAASGYAPSPELLQLVEQAHAEPDVREDRVQAVASRLREGYYHAPASAQATATAMLRAPD